MKLTTTLFFALATLSLAAPTAQVGPLMYPQLARDSHPLFQSQSQPAALEEREPQPEPNPICFKPACY